MPSKNLRQHNLMAMVAHDPAAAKRLKIPQSVGQDFVAADKGKKFAEGGNVKESKAMEERHVRAMKKAGVPKKIVREEEAEAKEMKYAKGGFVRAADGIARKGKTQAKQVKMCGGGMAKGKR